MLKKYNTYRVLRVFLESPTESFGLRELSRISGLAPLSVMRYLKDFQKEELISRYEKNKIPFYRANRDNLNFVLYKKMSIYFEINNSGFVDFVWDNLAPKAIILFGSYARGESIETSDIDICVIGKENKVNLDNFEKTLNKKIHITFIENIKDTPTELRNNIINGTILRGYITL